MIRRRRSAGHGSLRTITPTRAAFARPGPGGYPFPGVIARMQPSDSLIPIGLGSGRPLPSAYPGARATRSNEGLPGVRAVLFQRAVVVDPAGCGALLAHGAGPAVAFRLHEALGTQEDVVSRLQGLRPTRSRTYASATALPRSPQGSLPAWVGWPLTGRGSHPLDDTQGFMTYSSIPLDRPAWPHHATTPQPGGGPTRSAPPPRALPRPSASCDAAPRKGARPPRHRLAAGGRTPPTCAPRLAHRYDPARDRGTRGDGAGRRGRTRARARRPVIGNAQPGRGDRRCPAPGASRPRATLAKVVDRARLPGGGAVANSTRAHGIRHRCGHWLLERTCERNPGLRVRPGYGGRAWSAGSGPGHSASNGAASATSGSGDYSTTTPGRPEPSAR